MRDGGRVAERRFDPGSEACHCRRRSATRLFADPGNRGLKVTATLTPSLREIRRAFVVCGLWSQVDLRAQTQRYPCRPVSPREPADAAFLGYLPIKRLASSISGCPKAVA